MSGHDGAAPSHEAVAVPDTGDPEQSVVADYTESVVPTSARRSNFRMLLTFGSMQLVFGAVLVGYTARFEGFSLGRLIVAMAIAATTMTVYCIGSANVGAVVGQTDAVTTRGIFGTIGSALVSLLLVIDGMGFYLFTVLFVISLGEALIGTLPAVSLITAILAFVMIFNNYFGFTGLQLFAQYIAVPVVALWAVYATIKVLTSTSGHIAINGAQNLLSRIPRWRRQYTVIGLGLAAAGLTYILPSLTKTFNIVTGIGAITVPVASTIMAMDVFVVPRLFGLRRPLYRVATWSELALANWPAIVALVCGTAVGAFTGGLVPGTSGFGHTYIGFPALQAWVTGAVVYLAGVAVVARGAKAKDVLGYSRIEEVDAASAAAVGGVGGHGGS